MSWMMQPQCREINNKTTAIKRALIQGNTPALAFRHKCLKATTRHMLRAAPSDCLENGRYPTLPKEFRLPGSGIGHDPYNKSRRSDTPDLAPSTRHGVVECGEVPEAVSPTHSQRAATNRQPMGSAWKFSRTFSCSFRNFCSEFFLLLAGHALAFF